MSRVIRFTSSNLDLVRSAIKVVYRIPVGRCLSEASPRLSGTHETNKNV